MITLDYPNLLNWIKEIGQDSICYWPNCIENAKYELNGIEHCALHKPRVCSNNDCYEYIVPPSRARQCGNHSTNQPKEKRPIWWRVLDKRKVSLDGCWEYTGSRTPTGYGRVSSSTNGVPIYDYAHRIAYRETHGKIVSTRPHELNCINPKCGVQVDHLCRNRACFNPAHLEAVYRCTNLARGWVTTPTATRIANGMGGHDTYHEGCLVENCEEPHCALGYCTSHYWRFKRTGTTEARPRISRASVCSIEDCGKKHKAHGYCDMHYRRLQRTGVCYTE